MPRPRKYHFWLQITDKTAVATHVVHPAKIVDDISELLFNAFVGGHHVFFVIHIIDIVLQYHSRHIKVCPPQILHGDLLLAVPVEVIELELFWEDVGLHPHSAARFADAGPVWLAVALHFLVSLLPNDGVTIYLVDM